MIEVLFISFPNSVWKRKPSYGSQCLFADLCGRELGGEENETVLGIIEKQKMTSIHFLPYYLHSMMQMK